MEIKKQKIVTVKKKRSSWFDKVFLIFSFLLAIFVAYYVWVNAQQGSEPFIFGYRPYIVTSGSMEPYLKVNSLIVIKKNNYEDVKAGDIISYTLLGASGKTHVCHQVVDVTSGGLVTKGINNTYNDMQTVKKEQYVGKLVFRSNTVANYINFINKKGFFVAVVLPIAGIFFLIFAFAFLRKEKNGGKVVKIIETVEIDDENQKTIENKDEPPENKLE